MFSPVDANQLVCTQMDGLYVVDIRKPKRSVLLLKFNVVDFCFLLIYYSTIT